MSDLRAEYLWSREGRRDELEDIAVRLDVTKTGRCSSMGLRVNGARVVFALVVTTSRDTDRRGQREVLAGVNVSVKFERAGDARRTRAEDQAPPDVDAPSIVLRRETSDDRDDKANGVTHEVQTGFDGFDRMVFVDNDSTEADARRVLSKEATRQAVLRLLQRTQVVSVDISTTGASLRFRTPEERVDVGEFLIALEDLLIVARAGGPREARPERRGETLAALSVATGLVSLPYAFFVWVAFHVSYLPLLIGAVVGGALGFLMRGVFDRLVAGDSGSGRRARTMTVMTAVTLAGAFGGTLALLNCVLDDEPPTVMHGIVTAVHKGKSGYVEVRFPEGTARVGSSSDALVGMKYSVAWHRGAFGFGWSDGIEFK